MKRKRASKGRKLKKPLQNNAMIEAEELENITSMHMETENPRTSTVTRGRQEDLKKIEKSGYERMKSNPNALDEIIVNVIKEISKEANISRSLVDNDNSISNEQMSQPHADMDLQENESQPHQVPEYNQEELNDALTVIKKTMKLDAADPFNRPVDAIALDIPDYFDVIETPMDFGTICNNLENGLKYMNSADVFKDVEYIWYNCVKYNKKGDYILELMKRVKTFFMRYWKAAGLQTKQSPPIVESSSILMHNKQENHPPPPPPTSNSSHLPPNETGPTQLADNEVSLVNMQAGQSQTPESSNLSESSQEHYEPAITTPDSTVIQKKQKSRGPAREVGLLKSIKRIKVITNELGQPVGPEACKLTSFLGRTARDGNLAPLTYASWLLMPEEYKENMWQKVLMEFDIDPSCRRWALMSLRTKWRNFKSRLKTMYYDAHETDEERLADCDHRVLPDQWSALVSLWSSEKWQKLCAKNKANRAKLKYAHTTGKKSFARLLEEERAKRSNGEEPSQAELFILTRTRKNGQPINEATAAVISQLRESTPQTEETKINKNKLETDVCTRVKGQDGNFDVSLYGLYGSPSLVGPGIPTRTEALKMVADKTSEVLEMKDRLASVEQTCSQMAAQMSQMVSMMTVMHKNFLGQNDPNPVDGTPFQSEPLPTSVSNQEVPEKQLEPNSIANDEVPARQTRGRKKRR